MKDSHFWFLRFNITILGPDANELHRMIRFGNPELFFLLKGKTHLHVDGTFYCVPCRFTELLVLIIYDEQTEMYVPVLCV